MQNGSFKTTAFGGFDKKSVLDYIDSITARYTAVEADYKTRLQGYEGAQNSQLAHIQTIEQQLAQTQDKLETLADQLETEREQTRETYDQLKQAAEHVSDLQQRCDKSERERKALTEQCRQLKFRAESLEYKGQKYDEITGQIGDMLLDARRDAEQIISEAHARAAIIERQAHENMDSLYQELSSFSGDADRLHKSIEEILLVLNDRVDVMQGVIQQVEKRFTFGNEPEPADEPEETESAEEFEDEEPEEADNACDDGEEADAENATQETSVFIEIETDD